MDIKDLPVFPDVIPELLEKEAVHAFKVNVATETEDGHTVYETSGGRIFVYAVDDGLYLMPEWVSNSLLKILFDMKSKMFKRGVDAGRKAGIDEEQQRVMFYGKLLHGMIDVRFSGEK